MWVFYILLFLPMVIRFLGVQRREPNYQKVNSRAIFVFFVLLTALVMLRHDSVGNDTKNYIYYFKVFSRMDWSDLAKESIEIGYVYFNKIVSLISNDYRVFFVISALAVTALIYPTYRRLCVDPTLTIVLFVTMSTFVMMFSGIRQMLAIALGFVAYHFTRKKKLLLFILTVLFAMAFHTSAFMLALMYPIYHIRLGKRGLLGIIPILLMLLLLNEPIFSFLSTYIERYTRFDAEITSTGAYTMLILFAIFTVFAFAVPDEKKMDNETVGLRNFLILSLALQMFAPLHTLAMRMNYYYIIFIPLLIPKIIEYSSKNMKRVTFMARYIMILFFAGYFLYTIYNSDGGLNVFPYHFYWESAI